MIGGRKSRSNKGKKRGPYGPRSRTRSGSKFRGRKVAKKVKSKKVLSNNVSNVTNNAPVIRAGTNVRPTFNTMNKAQRKRKVRSNKGKKRGPYSPRSRTRSGGSAGPHIRQHPSVQTNFWLSDDGVTEITRLKALGFYNPTKPPPKKWGNDAEQNWRVNNGEEKLANTIEIMIANGGVYIAPQ